MTAAARALVVKAIPECQRLALDIRQQRERIFNRLNNDRRKRGSIRISRVKGTSPCSFILIDLIIFKRFLKAIDPQIVLTSESISQRMTINTQPFAKHL